MQNPHVIERLSGIQKALTGLFQAGSSMSAASKGQERAGFIDEYLSQVLPPTFRCGSGDITDTAGQRSGQVDVVVEYPFLPSLPSLAADSPRLYLAEGVAAAIEVKSDLAAQWTEVVETAKKVAQLNRDLKAAMFSGPPPGPKIPFFVAGYRGWAKLQTIEGHLGPGIDGILVIDPPGFVSKSYEIAAEGSWALWGLICALHTATSSLKISSAHPLDYAIGPPPPP